MHEILVSIVYATPIKQWLQELSVKRGTSAGELVERSRILHDIPDLKGRSIESLKLGIYAEKVDSEYLMQEGDRLEIYRELSADPKEVRRQLALMGKSMGKK